MPEPKNQQLVEERAQIARSGRLHAIHWLVIGASLVLTIGAWQYSLSQVRQKIEARFDSYVEQVVELTLERLVKYEDALRAGVAAIHAAGGHMDHASWLSFADNLKIEERYPGINGIGVIFPVARSERADFEALHAAQQAGFGIHPEHDNHELLPITYIEPLADNRAALGLDMAHEANRYAAAAAARRSGRTHITGPIVLVQDQQRTPGFLLFVPYYRPARPADEQARLASFAGIVYAPFVVKKLIAGTLDPERREVNIRIRDDDVVLYDEIGVDDTRSGRVLSRRVEQPLFGRSWTFDIESSARFAASARTDQPVLILIGGLFIDALLLILFTALARSNRRALAFADRATAGLEVANTELERFAYVAAHDLRAPLRGMKDLAEFLGEDLEDYLATPEANPAVARNLGRITQQASRMEGLIASILEYSAIGTTEPSLAMFDIEAVARDLRRELGIEAQQLQVESPPSAFMTAAIPLEQVLSNLVGNAFKYHPAPEDCVVVIAMTRQEGWFEFSVRDNGAGIDPRHHDKIFEPFITLQPRDRVESAGVGLAIVRKIVENFGGRVRVESSAGAGATFRFTWPVEIDGGIRGKHG